jgi:hypothetical protein
MADETMGPQDATAPTPAQQVPETAPGRDVDMSEFELAFAGPSATGPVVEWVVQWPDGRVIGVSGEDEALFIARNNPTCRVGRRVVSPWLRTDAIGE